MHKAAHLTPVIINTQQRVQDTSNVNIANNIANVLQLV
jgi:hypothetical protein